MRLIMTNIRTSAVLVFNELAFLTPPSLREAVRLASGKQFWTASLLLVESRDGLCSES